jgi:hypothetical protein
VRLGVGVHGRATQHRGAHRQPVRAQNTLNVSTHLELSMQGSRRSGDTGDRDGALLHENRCDQRPDSNRLSPFATLSQRGDDESA